MALRLIIEDDEGNTEVVRLGRDAITIGRQEGNTIQLTEKNVSRRHARLVPDGREWILEDLGSYNGIKINGQAIEGRALLQEGDVVQIGDYHLALSEDADRRTVNYDRPPDAANDTVDIVLASSSSDLPKLGADELPPLKREHVAPGIPTYDPDLAAGDDFPDIGPVGRPRQSAGVFIGFALVVVLALGGGGLWLATSGRLPGAWFATDPPAQTMATNTVAVDRPTAGALAAQAPVVEADATPKPVPEPPAAEPVDPPDPLPAEVEMEPVEAPSEEKAALSPSELPAKAARVQRNRRARQERRAAMAERDRKEKAAASEAAPAVAAVDVERLYEDAKGELYRNKNYTKAFELAKQAWTAEHSQRAAALMATAACKMGDTAKAKFAVNKLKGQKKDQAIKVCELYQVSL